MATPGGSEHDFHWYLRQTAKGSTSSKVFSMMNSNADLVASTAVMDPMVAEFWKRNTNWAQESPCAPCIDTQASPASIHPLLAAGSQLIVSNYH